jgi:hypothetical protein
MNDIISRIASDGSSKIDRRNIIIIVTVAISTPSTILLFSVEYFHLSLMYLILKIEFRKMYNDKMNAPAPEAIRPQIDIKIIPVMKKKSERMSFKMASIQYLFL